MKELTLRGLDAPIALLDRVAPASLEQLRAEFPGYEGILRVDGPVLGAGDPDEESELAARTWAEALRAGAAEAAQRAPQVRRSLDNADRLELLAELGSAIGGSTLLALIFAEASTASKAVTGALTLICSFAAIVARYLRKSHGGSRLELYVKLLQAIGDAKVLALQLEIWAKSKPPRPPLDPAMAASAATIVKELSTIVGLLV